MRIAGVLTSKLNFRKLKHALASKWLYLLHLLTGRQLELIFISKPESVIFSNGYFTLYWEVKGCHEISVNDKKLPGNASLIQLDPVRLQGPVILRFYGSREMIVKTYRVSPVHLQTMQLAHMLIREPGLRQLDQAFLLTEEPVELQLPLISFSARLELRGEPDSITFHTSLLQVQLDTCEIPQYNP